MKKQLCIVLALIMFLMTFAAFPAVKVAATAPNYPRGVADIKSGEVKVVFENLPTEYIEVKELYSLRYYMEKYPKAKEIMGYYKGTLYYWTKDEKKVLSLGGLEGQKLTLSIESGDVKMGAIYAPGVDLTIDTGSKNTLTLTLGSNYKYIGAAEKNMAEAERLLEASALQKNSQAQYLLARLYLCEDGIPKDAEKALHWLKESAAQKNQYAQYQLGKMLLFGKEVERDIEAGVELLTAAADQGNVYAARLLQSYYIGRLRSPSVGMASLRLLSRLTRMFEDRLKKEDRQRAAIDRKLRRKIEEKKQLHGLRME